MIGRNGLLINSVYASLVFIGDVVTDVPPEDFPATPWTGAVRLPTLELLREKRTLLAKRQTGKWHDREKKEKTWKLRRTSSSGP